MQSVAKNDQMELSITAMSSEGAGIGRVDGMAVFVPGTAVGDTAFVRVIKVNRNYAVGKLLTLLEPSDSRVEPDCSVFPRCGGCVYRHISYAEECRIKQVKVADALRRIGGVELESEPILASAQIDSYRNKAQYPVGRSPEGDTIIGFYAARSHRIVNNRCCRLQPPEFDAALAAFSGWMKDCAVEPYEEATGRGVVRHLYLRSAPATGQQMACVVTATEKLSHADELCRRLRRQVPGICSILHNVHPDRTNLVLGKRFITLWGEEAIEDALCGMRVRISPRSFYQVNSPQAERLYRKAAELAALRPDDVLLDLYCGTGTIGLSMASQVSRVIGVEVVPDAVEDARRNALANDIHNAEFFCMDAAQAAESLARQGLHPDVVLLDPPRKGCSGELVEIVAQSMAPDRVVYVSCDPATLARDLACFVEQGYTPIRAVPVDLFPRTAHVESIVLLSHKSPDSVINVKVEFGEGEGKVPLGAIAERAKKYQPKPKITYRMIQEYVEKNYGFKVHTAYIAEVKRSLGLTRYDAFNVAEQLKQPRKHPPKEKVEAIKDALKHFEVI